MAHLSGTFSTPHAGKLRCTLVGNFYQGTNRDAGFPSGDSNMLIKAVVNGNSMFPIDRHAPTSTFDLDYPGASASWSISTSTVATYTNGVATYGFSSLKLTLRLLKK